MLDDLSSPAAIAHYIAAHRPAPAGPPSAPPPGDAAAEKVSLAQAGPFGPEVTPASAPVIARHGPFAPINKSAGDALSPRQQQHLDALIERYNAKTRRSKEHTQQHRDHFSDPRAVSGFRVTWKELTYPIVSVRSAGSKIWDLDGNEFLDVTMGFGTYLFGHNPEFIRRAIEKQLATGIEIGPQNALAGEIAQTMCRLSGMDRVTFCTTGSEAVMGAVRAARTVTGRNKVVYFSGDYHGIHEEVLAKGQWAQGKSRTLPIAPGIPNELVSQVHVLTYGDPASLEWIRANAASLAAVLVEPVQSRKPELQPRNLSWPCAS
jgi:4-aminobutyrate aminotransferase-like enzyme